MTVGLSTTAIFGDLCGYFFGNARDETSNITWRYATVLDARRSRGRTTTSSSDARTNASGVESSYLQGFCEESAWIQARTIRC